MRAGCRGSRAARRRSRAPRIVGRQEHLVQIDEEIGDGRVAMQQRKTTDEFCRYWREEFSSPDQLRIWSNAIRRSKPKPRVKKKAIGSAPVPDTQKSHAAVA